MCAGFCQCICHAPDDEERDERSTFYGVDMLDPVAVHTARPCCAADHWKAFYLATEPERPAPREKTKWVDGASSA